MIDEIAHWKKLMKDTERKIAWKKIVADNDMLIDKKIDKVLGPEVDYTCYKDMLWISFIVFIDHKITCCKVAVLHSINGIDFLDIWSIYDFS